MGKRTGNGTGKAADSPAPQFPRIVPGFLVAVSDFHIGKDNSCLPGNRAIMDAYQKAIDHAQHVVYIGDIYELFDLQKRKSAGDEIVVEFAMEQAIAFFDKQIRESPNRMIHFVLGNHEDMKEFREKLDALQARHAKLNGNFEWHPEAIKIGNALFTHGDLQLDGNPGRRGDGISRKKAASGLRDGPRSPKPQVTEPKKEPGYAAPTVHATLSLSAANGSRKTQGESISEDKLLRYSEMGKEGIFDREVWNNTEHVFFGHTHIPFAHFRVGDKKVHNPGSTKMSHIKTMSDLGFIAGEIGADGKLDHLTTYGAYQSLTPSQRSIEEYERVERGSGYANRRIAEGYAAGLSDDTPRGR